MWRQTILPCSPQKMMSCLVDLLKKYHDFQWRLHPLKQIVWLHRKITKKRIFPHLITRWNRFNQWHGRVHCPKWTSTLLPLEFSRKNKTIIADVLISSRPSVSRVPSYPLVNVYITMENHHYSWEKSLFLWWCSIVFCMFTRPGSFQHHQLILKSAEPSWFDLLYHRDVINFVSPWYRRKWVCLKIGYPLCDGLTYHFHILSCLIPMFCNGSILFLTNWNPHLWTNIG